MDCTWPKNLPSSKKKAIEELVQGHDIANQLRSLLNKSAGDNNNSKAAPAEDLVFDQLRQSDHDQFINIDNSGEVMQSQEIMRKPLEEGMKKFLEAESQRIWYPRPISYQAHAEKEETPEDEVRKFKNPKNLVEDDAVLSKPRLWD
nr:uncharacterized protein LOC112028911 [Quercus suber]